MSQTTISRTSSVVMSRALTLAGAVMLLFTSESHAVPHTWLNNSGLAGTFNTLTHWDSDGDATPGGGGDTIPGSVDTIFFNNSSASPYLVTFTGDIVTQQFNFGTDKVTLDLAGNRWTAQVDPGAGFDFGGSTAASSSWIGHSTGQSTTLTLSSSVAPVDPTVDNVVRNYDGVTVYRATNVGGTGASSTLNINTSLGYGVTMMHTGTFFLGGDSTLNIDGVGSEFTGANFAVTASLGGGGNTTTNLTNGGKFTYLGPVNVSASTGLAIVNVESGSTFTSNATQIGLLNSAQINIKTGGVWNATTAQLGVYHFYDVLPISVKLDVDGATSAFNGTSITLGTGIASQDSNAEVTLKNGGTLSITNRLLLNVLSAGAITAGRQANTVTLDDGVIHVNGGVSDMRLIENHGILRGTGAIDNGASSFSFTVTNESFIDVGDISGAPGSGTTIGAMEIADGSLVQNSGGTTYFDFNPSISGAADLIDVVNGTITLGGTVDFDLVAGSLLPGKWEFLRADSITYTASDNMAALLAILNPDPLWTVSFGVVNNGNQDVLQLQVLGPVPEPATWLLVGVGCVGLAWRVRRKR